MSKFAWVTLATNDTYSLGALVLAHSLKRVSTAHQLAILITPGVSESMRNQLKDVYNVIQEVNVMDSKDSVNLALLSRPELGVTFTKLNCWRLLQFEKCVFLDADTLILQNCDELFDREEFSAAPDVSWPDCFNSGVFVYRPSLETYSNLTALAVKEGSFDGGDQGLLNQYFSDWAHKDISKHLPFTYNTTAYASYCYLPAFKQFRDNIKILHFAGKLKPWLVTFDSQSRTAHTPSEYQHASDLIQLWWNIFCDNVHQQLSQEMTHYTVEYSKIPTHVESIPEMATFGHSEYVPTFHDPWEDYYQKLMEEQNDVENVVNEDVEEDTQSEIASSDNQVEQADFTRSHTPPTIVDHVREAIIEEAKSGDIMQYIPDYVVEAEIEINTETASVCTITTNFQSENEEIISNDSLSAVESDEEEAGLAGALSTLRLGERRTPEQEAYEQLMRRQCWEAGNIDYSGKDSFDNIWRRISQTMESKPEVATAATSKSESVPVTPLKSKADEKSDRLTSVDIKDGKVEFDPKTNAKSEYKLIKGGYEVKTTTPQPNGTNKIQVQTFWDPMDPEELKRTVAEYNAGNKKPSGTIEKVDKDTTVEYRDIEGGHEEIYTTIKKDGTRSIKKKTFYDAKISSDNDETNNKVQNNNAINKNNSTVVSKKKEERKVLKKTDSQDSNYQLKHEQTVEESRKMTQTTEISGKTTVTRKGSIQEQSIKSITSQQATSDKKDSKKKKPKGAPAPPPDFVENDSTTIDSKRVNGGTEYTFTTTLEDGRTITTTKTVYEEEEIEMTEEEIQQYKKQLKDAEKHKNITKTKTLKSESGTKKIVPSENAGDVTTVETIKIEGGTEFHYTTVTSQGIVKKSVKTVYDAVRVEGSEDEDEEEIIEEYEEEIIEPGETTVKTVESSRFIEKSFDSQTIVTKKEKKTKK